MTFLKENKELQLQLYTALIKSTNGFFFPRVSLVVIAKNSFDGAKEITVVI